MPVPVSMVRTATPRMRKEGICNMVSDTAKNKMRMMLELKPFLFAILYQVRNDRGLPIVEIRQQAGSITPDIVIANTLHVYAGVSTEGDDSVVVILLLPLKLLDEIVVKLSIL